MKLWKFDRIAGWWKIERSFDDPANGPVYLELYRQEEPKELFTLSVRKPKGPKDIYDDKFFAQYH